ncbi:MAG: YkgJ family cysteine cluster protein [Vicinamibacterales bacterium]
MRAFCLSIHARYRCRHSGACCTAGWPIPIEAERAASLRTRGVGAHTGAQATFVPAPGNPGLLHVAASAAGACVFFDEAHGRLCTIHRDAGEAVMPSACRNFPRVALRDGRGLFVTLSHYCPTAARLLLSASEISIVEAPATMTLSGDVEGLDASGVLPPLLRPDMLADLEGYGAWERAGIGILGDRVRRAADALAVIRSATRDAVSWRPGPESLAARVERAFARADVATPPPARSRSPLDLPTKAFLAAHLIANWAAYQNGGLSAVVEALDDVLAVLQAELAERGLDREMTSVARPEDIADRFVDAVRAVDLRVRHTTDHTTPHVRTGSLPSLRHD